MQTKNICVSLGCGRLGNMMFGIASGLYYAKQHNLDYVYINDECGLDYIYELQDAGMFKNICIVDNYQYVTIMFENDDAYTIEEPYKMGTVKLPMPDKYGNVCIKGLRENPRYFTKEFALELYKPSKELVQAIKNLYGDVDLAKATSVHVRRGDYLTTDNFIALPMDYYTNLISILGKDGRKFIIVSDDIRWCKMQFNGDNIIFADRNIDGYPAQMVDMYLMSLCGNNILSCSLFSWWGAYLNENPDRQVYYTLPYYTFAENGGVGIIPDEPNWNYISNSYIEKQVAVCAIIKMENLYIREWVEHYKNIGVSKIFLYDNNDEDGENPAEPIIDYVQSGYVSITNFRGKKTENPNCSIQVQAYQDCMDRHMYEYGWIGYFDADEFLQLNGDMTISEFISQDKFKDFHIICANWLVFDDNGNIRYDNRPLKERFTHPSETQKAKSMNMFIKSIVKCGVQPNGISWINSGISHIPLCRVNGEYPINLCCDMSGNGSPFLSWPENGKTEYEPANIVPEYSSGYIMHFIHKTAEEYFKIKRKRLYPDMSIDFNEKLITPEEFFSINEDTPEKRQVIDEILAEATHQNYKVK